MMDFAYKTLTKQSRNPCHYTKQEAHGVERWGKCLYRWFEIKFYRTSGLVLLKMTQSEHDPRVPVLEKGNKQKHQKQMIQQKHGSGCHACLISWIPKSDGVQKTPRPSK